jgi:hypothetical protein
MVATTARVNRSGRDVRSAVPAASTVPGIVALDDRELEIWRLAQPYLRTRDNDGHSLYAFGLASALLDRLPGAVPRIVRPAILLHDVGWSTIPEADALAAISPGGGRPDLVRKHEVEGAVIARDILEQVGVDPEDIDEIVGIIDGHDTRLEAISLNDSVVKDADKLWRLTPHGLRVVCDWFGLDADESLRLCASRVLDHLFTEPARGIASALTALASIDRSPQAAVVAESARLPWAVTL